MILQGNESGILTYAERHYIPHYQPIIDVMGRRIVGYEVLGRVQLPGSTEATSLGAQFHDPESDSVKLLQIDRVIREKAIRHLKETGINTKLFLNMMPNFLSLIFTGDILDVDRLHIIHLIEKYQINKEEIVLEITEDKFEGDIDRLLYIVNIFRTYGMKIAVDDLGVGFSNLERIGYIHPDIIKVDIKIMRESLNNSSFKHVLSAISEMSEKLGSQLLFEGVENEDELHLALSMGANLLQGFYFSRPSSDFLNRNHFSKSLKATVEQFSGLRFLEILETCRREDDLIQELSAVFGEVESDTDEILTASVKAVLPTLPKEVFEIIVCDLHGYQRTPTYARDKKIGKWSEDVSEIGYYHAWKPYFIKHKAKGYHFHRKWSVTDPFFDIERQMQYVTFAYSLPDQLLLARVRWDS